MAVGRSHSAAPGTAEMIASDWHVFDVRKGVGLGSSQTVQMAAIMSKSLRVSDQYSQAPR